MMNNWDEQAHLNEVAVIGMIGRFPGASTVDALWQNLCRGVESISFFTHEELRSLNIDPAWLDRPNFVKAKGMLDDIELFDAAFFGYSARDAQVMDPQHRLFLQGAWEALEQSGYTADGYRGAIGIYAGSNISSYLLQNLYPYRDLIETVGQTRVKIANDKDFLTTRVSHQLNLTGPSVTVQTACSTSLVAVHLACQNLITGECDIALAGGVSITLPQKSGYVYQPEGIASPDGHCRAFDAQAQGTVVGDGLGIVVLKRFSEAVADGDTILAVIKGSAVNNDGALKVGYTAPSIEGQAKAITEAMTISGVDPETITYVEAHGTATPLGDPIEVAALTQAYRAMGASQNGFCALGSIKTNIGHLDAAAGIAGLIKTVLALQHKAIPPSLHYTRPNPKIDFDQSPFYVNASLTPWETGGERRRAGVSSFGIGGTNAHVILEEAPPPTPSGAGRPQRLLILSAKTAAALKQASQNLARHLRQHPALNLDDVAYTLQVGRKAFSHRQMVVCQGQDEAIAALEAAESGQMFTAIQETGKRPLVFLFPGQGSQYPSMGQALYQLEPVYRQQVDECADILQPHLGFDLRQVLYPADGPDPTLTHQLNQTAVAQPALFTVSCALAKLWLSWGIRPQAMIGHSIGEYVAAYLAGVFTLEGALALVAQRGQLMQAMPPGAMVAVQHPADALTLPADLSVAAINSPSQCVVSGPHEAIARFETQLESEAISYRRLHTSHAFHSAMMAGMMEPFAQQVAATALMPPKIPYLSNVTGTWVTDQEATDPNYWVRHVRQTVQFCQGLTVLGHKPEQIWLEVGPGRTLSNLVRSQVDPEPLVLASLPHRRESGTEAKRLMKTLGQLWLAGLPIRWPRLYWHQARRRLPLPTYPFEAKRYWIDPPSPQAQAVSRQSLYKKSDAADWFYVPSWQRTASPDSLPPLGPGSHWLLFAHKSDLGASVRVQLEAAQQQVTVVQAGIAFNRFDAQTYTIRPDQPADYTTLLQDLPGAPQFIVHLWQAEASGDDWFGDEDVFRRIQNEGFYSLLYLAQALDDRFPAVPVRLISVTNQVFEVHGQERVNPAQATLLGPVKVMPQEYPHLTCQHIDIAIPASGEVERLARQIMAEAHENGGDAVVAYRGRHRWRQTFAPIKLPDDRVKSAARLRPQGVYLITGGLGGVGLVLAAHLAQTVQARLVLIGRSPFPARPEWPAWLAEHEASDPVCDQIEKIKNMEAAGARVLVVQADVTEASQMQAVLAQAREAFGEIHGVIHSAGLPGGGIIQLKTPQMAAQVLGPKVKGTLILAHLFKETPLDFFILHSSLNALWGGPGQVDYCAANAFLDAFAHAWPGQPHTQVTAINWDLWLEVGMAAREQSERDADLAVGLLPAEGVQVFDRVLASRQPQVIVSIQDLLARLQHYEMALAAAADPQSKEGGAAAVDLPAAEQGTDQETMGQKLTAIWQALIGVEQIGGEANFFELGGDSLIALQLLGRVREAFGVDLPIAQFFADPTMNGLESYIKGALNQGMARPPIPAIPAVSRERPHYPLSFAQLRLWFLDQLGAGNAYNICAAFRLEGVLQTEVLQQSLDEVTRRHETLRTYFIDVAGKPAQVIQPDLMVTLAVVDLTMLPETAQSAQVRDFIDEAAQRPFDLTTPPLLRVHLLRLSDQVHILLITMHHIISDQWSVGILLNEVAALYEAFSAGRPSPLAPLPCQYVDFAVWQREWLQGEILDQQLNYWQDQLKGELPVLRLTQPLEEGRDALTFSGASRPFVLPTTLHTQLMARCQEEEVTPFIFLVAVFKALLYRYTGQDDLIVGTIIANRHPTQLEQLIGFFANTLVLRTRLPQRPTFRTLLRQVRDVTLGAYSHKELPFEKLIEVLNPRRSVNRTPLFQVAFTFRNAPIPVPHASLTATTLQVENPIAKFDLHISLAESSQGLSGTVDYDMALFTSDMIDSLVSHYQLILEQAVLDPDSYLLDMPLTQAQAEEAVPVNTRDETEEFNF